MHSAVRGSGSGLVVWPVFKTATEAPPAAPVGSIPTRSRHSRDRHPHAGAFRDVTLPRALTVAVLLLAAGAAPCPLHAQDTAAVAPAEEVDTAGTEVVAPRDTAVFRPISPINAFWRSFLLPGWGQARLNRKLTGGIFIAWEGVTLGMSLKTRHELAFLRRTGSVRAENKRREHEDWLVLLAFNHLFAGLEAYVGAHLADFPGDLRITAAPGGVGASVSVPLRLR
jgi:hypothetical protein